jgi:peptidoglycan hydrolase-like protein with peptidoglycan-binding domain
LFEAPLAHELVQHSDTCNCAECCANRELAFQSAGKPQGADQFVTQMNLGVTRTKEGHEILTRIVADDVIRSMPSVYIDRAALLRGVTRPDKGTGSVVDSGRSIVHSVDADQQKRHSLRTKFNQSTADALTEIQCHLRQLQVQALDATLAGSLTIAFEMIGEALHLIQDSYSQAHTERTHINDINAPHPIRKIRFFGFVGLRPSRYPDEHQVIGYSLHVPFGDPRDDIHDDNGNLKPEAQAAVNASREFLVMMLGQMARRPQPPYNGIELAELRAFKDWHLSTNPVHTIPSPSPKPSPSPSGGRPLLRRGSRGPSVRELQSRLNQWLMSNPRPDVQPLTVDGLFGPLTQAVVQAFQSSERLTADGVVGMQTWGRLLKSRPSPTPPSPQPIPPAPGSSYPLLSRFVPARYFTRPTSPRQINRVVIHITAGGSNINGTIRWFQDPASNVSAHYIVGQDGEVVQMVRDSDIAWHAHSANGDSIGIEHVARPRGGFGRNDSGLFPTQEQYCSSANLVRWLCYTYSIPMDRVHILGHSEADPHTTHRGCPNAVWDWERYMHMVSSTTPC